jgi:hypothetical protein
MKDKHDFAVLMLLLWLLPAAYIISCQSIEQKPSRGARTSTHKIQHVAAVNAISTKTPDNFMIAFIGDQGPKAEALAVLELIKSEGADAVVHSGDFDYEHNPAAWEAKINAILGADFPYFACVGNHDRKDFYGAGGYQEFMEARMHRLGIPWDGDLGVKSSFVFNGIFFLLTGPNIFGYGHAEYIRDRLAEDNSIWRISSWHENMRLMQVGGKLDQTGWGVYEESRKGGAIIATAHEHTYSRTHLLSNCQNQTVASASDTLMLSIDDPATSEDEGKSFVFVSALGGKSIRNQELDGKWWASIYTSTQGANAGALFGIFNYEGKEGLAKFYFKDIAGKAPDEFYVISPVRNKLVSFNFNEN